MTSVEHLFRVHRRRAPDADADNDCAVRPRHRAGIHDRPASLLLLLLLLPPHLSELATRRGLSSLRRQRHDFKLRY